MTQVSKYPISKQVSDRMFEIFLMSLVQIKNINEADEFISDFLTPTEKIMLAKRIAIAFLLEKGYEYRTIQKVVKVSAPTIASINVTRKYGSRGYVKLLNKLMKEDALNNLFEEAIVKLLSLPASATKGGALWQYLKQQAEQERQKKKQRRNAL